MKVLDPQAALLTVTELHDFLSSSKIRPEDRSIGAYESVNTHNYVSVRHDVNNYIQNIAPHVTKQSPSDQRMTSLLRNLKQYELTKTEVFSLINLGVGSHQTQVATDDAEETVQNVPNGNTDQVEGADKGIGETQETGDDEEEPAESGLDRMLFGLVVEEADERFAGDGGEQRIAEVLAILKDALIDSEDAAAGHEMNGTRK